VISRENNDETTFSANVIADVSKATSSVSFKVILLVGIALTMYTASTGSVSNTREHFSKMNLLF
jgi:hypothetical protein